MRIAAIIAIAGALVFAVVLGAQWMRGAGEPAAQATTTDSPTAATDVVSRRTLEHTEEFTGVGPDGVQRLAPRAFHDLFLVLARARLSQRGTGSVAEEGWLYFDDLCRMLGRSRQRVNVEVFRTRQQLAELGIADAVEVFQRRAPTRQIRLSITDLTIDPL